MEWWCRGHHQQSVRRRERAGGIQWLWRLSKSVTTGTRCLLLSLNGELRFPGPLLQCGPSLVGSRWMGKLAAERRDFEAVVTSRFFEMGRDAQRALLRASSSQLMYSGTRGSSSHHNCILTRRPTMSVASSPAMEVARCCNMSCNDNLL